MASGGRKVTSETSVTLGRLRQFECVVMGVKWIRNLVTGDPIVSKVFTFLTSLYLRHVPSPPFLRMLYIVTKVTKVTVRRLARPVTPVTSDPMRHPMSVGNSRRLRTQRARLNGVPASIYWGVTSVTSVTSAELKSRCFEPKQFSS